MTKRAEVENYLKKHFPGSCDAALAKLDQYYEWLLDVNRSINLISRKTDPEDIWTHHFLDSLLSTACVDYRKKNIIDIGTGGGFPGVPLAILYPDSHFTLLDSTKKKIQAVKAGVSKLSLTNCSFLDTRLEEVPKKYCGAFDIAVSRSVRIIPEYKKKLLNLLNDDGRIVLYKSQKLDDAALFTKVTITDVGSPLIGERKIVVIKKSENI